MDYQNLAQQAAAVAKKAGALILGMERPEVFTKEGHANFVTAADYAAQELILRELAPLAPGAHFFAEEQENNRLYPGLNWIIDPIDGTTNFMRGCRHSAISIALAQDGVGVLGVVYNPFLDELFLGVRGGGAWRNGAPLRVSEEPMENAIIAIGTALYRRDLAERTTDMFRRLTLLCGDSRRTGSAALDLCYVAAGRYDGFYEAVLSPWDYAAAAVILQEAGGRIATLPGGGLDLSAPAGVVAGNPTVFEAVCKAEALSTQPE